MHLAALDDLLHDLFQAHGFRTTRDAALEGRSGEVYGAPVLAEKDDLVVIVERRGPDDTVDADTVARLARVVSDTGADLAVLAALGPVAAASGDPVVVWDRETVERVLGEAHVAKAAGTPPPALPLGAVAAPVQVFHAPDADPTPLPPAPPATSPAAAPPGPAAAPVAAPPASTEPATRLDDLLPPPFHEEAEAAPAGAAAPLRPFDLEAFETLSAPAASPRAAPSAASPPGDAPVAAPPKDAPTTAHPVLPPRLEAAQAAARVQARLFSVRDATLVLQPVHILDFELDLLVEGSLAYDTVRGRVEVHGTTKRVREVDPSVVDPTTAGGLPPGLAAVADERVLRVSTPRADELARTHLRETHTRVVEIHTDDPDANYAVSERRRVAPRPDHIRLVPRGVVQRPAWRVNGPNGVVLVDALTGEVVDEALLTPNPDVVVLD